MKRPARPSCSLPTRRRCRHRRFATYIKVAGRVELFFKWIKQHLRIKQFFGTSENAVKTQIWIAVSVYVLVAIVRKRLELDVSLYTLMQVFSVTVFEKASIKSVVFQEADSSEYVMADNQLNLFSF